MPSLFEIYKSKQDITSKNDLEELRKLYNSYDAYKKNYGFAEFVAYATEKSEQPLSKEILSMVETPKKEDPLKNYTKPIIDYGQDEYKSKFKMTKEDFNKVAPFKNYRRTLGGIADNLAKGTINFGMDLVDLFDTFGQSEVLEKLSEKKDISYDELKNNLQKEREELVQKGVTSVIKPVVGEDIYDGETIQKPEGIVGKLAVDVVPFVYGMSTILGTWRVRNGIHIEGDYAIFQLGTNQICILQPQEKKIALITKGKGPIVARIPAKSTP